jgi:hypothetical protein
MRVRRRRRAPAELSGSQVKDRKQLNDCTQETDCTQGSTAHAAPKSRIGDKRKRDKRSVSTLERLRNSQKSVP